MPEWGVLVLFVGIGVGVRILREVEGQHFANDTVSLLQVEEKEEKNEYFKWLYNRKLAVNGFNS